MPSAENAALLVETDLINGDPIVLAAKKTSCLNVLYDLITIMGKGRSLSSEESTLQQNYYAQAEKLRSKFEITFTNNNQKENFNKLYNEYKENDKMENYVLSKLVSNNSKSLILEKIKWISDEEKKEPIRIEQSKKIKGYKRIFGVVLMVVPFTLYAFWRGSRKFNRRNSSGVEIHKNYGEMVGTRSIETFAGFAAGILLLLGFLLLLGLL